MIILDKVFEQAAKEHIIVLDSLSKSTELTPRLIALLRTMMRRYIGLKRQEQCILIVGDDVILPEILSRYKYLKVIQNSLMNLHGEMYNRYIELGYSNNTDKQQFALLISESNAAILGVF